MAPRAGFISISGQLAYAQTNGAGVRGRIVSSRLGLLGQWQVHNSRADASVENFAVKANDTIDFIVDYMGGGRGGLRGK